MLTIVGRVCIGLGLALLVAYAGLVARGEQRSAAAIHQFERALAQAERLDERPATPPDQSLWSDGRIRAYAAAVLGFDAPVEGTLRIDAVGIHVPVFTGTSESVLAVGAGRIEGTPALGAGGNVGIAAHRDGYFRGLKDIEIGAAIVVETRDAVEHYEVFDVSIVSPEDVYVLDPTADRQVTLVTCYPFYFVGNAPQRFIVRARITETSART